MASTVTLIIRVAFRICMLSVLIASLTNGQVLPKGGIIAGIELSSWASTNTGPFSRTPGLSIGAFNEFRISGSSTFAFQLLFGLNAVRLIQYDIGRQFIFDFEHQCYRFTFDRQYSFLFFEFAFYPELAFSLANNSSIRLFAGPAYGYGQEQLISHETSRTQVDSLDARQATMYPYSRLDWRQPRLPRSFAIGGSLILQQVMVQLKYEFVSNRSEGDPVDYSSYFVLLGLAL